MALDVLLGLQWGDEGKGKVVDFLATRYHAIVRFQGGPNAGHTLVFNGNKYVLHTIPSGIYHTNLLNVIGNGVVIDPITLKKECETVISNGIDVRKQLLISKKSHIILPTHRLLDRISEVKKGQAKIGSTLKGIGPSYMDKTGRNGLRIGDMFHPEFLNKYETLKQKHLELGADVTIDFDLAQEEKLFFEGIAFLKTLTCIDSEYWLNDALQQGKNILAEGAQGTMLDIDFGTYPYVTSSNTIAAGVSQGTGIAPRHIRHVIGITKAYCTRVGSGPFPTELDNEIGETLRTIGNEFGSTTGRQRRCGWLDMVALKYACMINGVTQLVVTKVDVLNQFDEVLCATEYKSKDGVTTHFPFDILDQDYQPNYKSFKGWLKDLTDIKSDRELPLETSIYLEFIEKELNIPIVAISTGVDRHALIVKEW